MELIWKLQAEEIERLQAFVAQQSTNAFVRYRIKRNVESPATAVSIERFWEIMVGCLLTSQQRSGPGSPIIRLISTQPFPLSYGTFLEMAEPEAEAQRILKSFGGIRFTNRIPKQLAANFRALQSGLWERTQAVLQQVIVEASPAAERNAAAFIAKYYAGFGPKQSRNLLQGLWLSKYEIPIDSRITKWLNNFGFPVVLSSFALSDPHYYDFVSDGIQAMCSQSGIVPCVLDAAIFSSYDGDAWNDENMVWWNSEGS